MTKINLIEALNASLESIQRLNKYPDERYLSVNVRNILIPLKQAIGSYSTKNKEVEECKVAIKDSINRILDSEMNYYDFKNEQVDWVLLGSDINEILNLCESFQYILTKTKS